MAEESKDDRIARLRRELAGLEADERGDKPLTLAEIKAMSKEEVEENWDRVQRSLARVDHDGESDTSHGAGGQAKTTVHGPSRIAQAYAQKSGRFEAAQDGEGER